MKDLINIESSENPCTGCGACEQICPTKAIALTMNEEGFFSATVTKDKCICCGKCTKVCIKFGVEAATPRLEDGELFSAKSKDMETVLSCSSGGIAYELSKYALNNNFAVAGAIYNYMQGIVETVVIDTFGELEKLKGSKYLQSFTAEAYRVLVDAAKNGENKNFLVFGTPCQMYGLGRLLTQLNLRERFVLVDLFCHGVPSYLVWRSYLDSIQKKLGKEKITQINFRNKADGWHNFVMDIRTENGKFTQASEGCDFYKAFFDNVLLAEACFDCEVRCAFSGADIRLGDFWGKRYRKEEDGVSAVLLLSQRGRALFNDVKSIKVVEQVDLSECLLGQSVKKYTTKNLRPAAMQTLITTSRLNSVIAGYRKGFPIKKRIKLVIKESTIILPGPFRMVLKRLYKK